MSKDKQNSESNDKVKIIKRDGGDFGRDNVRDRPPPADEHFSPAPIPTPEPKPEKPSDRK